MICFNIAGFLAKPGFLWYCFLFRTAKESFSLLLIINGNENMKTNKTRKFDGPSWWYQLDKKLTKLIFKDIPNNWRQNPRKLKIYFPFWSLKLIAVLLSAMKLSAWFNVSGVILRHNCWCNLQYTRGMQQPIDIVAPNWGIFLP